jgi:hypothetical protein
VFVVAEQDADFFAEHPTAEIFHGHMRGDYGTFAGEGSKEAGHVGQNANIDARFARLLRRCCERPCRRDPTNNRYEFAPPHAASRQVPH